MGILPLLACFNLEKFNVLCSTAAFQRPIQARRKINLHQNPQHLPASYAPLENTLRFMLPQ
jgi:hypothetical protein